MDRRSLRLAVAVGWVALAVAWVAYLRASDQSPLGWLQGAIDAADGAWWAVPAFVLAYLARPLVLFPASLLTLAAGILFGPVVGVPLVLVAGTASALVAFGAATTFSPDALREAGGTALVERWRTRLHQESFLTVLLLRLAYLPFDLVSYAAGFVRIDVRAFAGATALGSVPGSVSFVLAGASLGRLDEGVVGLDASLLAASLAIFALSLGGSRLVRRRTGVAGAQGETGP